MIDQEIPSNASVLKNTSLHKVYTTCLILSQKWLCDQNSTMNTWRLLTRISSVELVKIEFYILTILKYDLNVSVVEFEMWENKCKVKYLQFITRENIINKENVNKSFKLTQTCNDYKIDYNCKIIQSMNNKI